jgi:hypothetical protein
MPIQPLLQIEAALLRRQMPDLLLRPGMTLAARVAERFGPRGIIVLAGTPLVAELPSEVSTGDKLKLMVQETRGEKVVMKLVQDQPAGPPVNPALGLPGGLTARIAVTEREAKRADGGEDHAAISLVYEGEALGSVSLRLQLAPGAVGVVAELPAGEPYELAADEADVLRSRVEAATGRKVSVTVRPRHEPLDVYV